ncbi:multiheme c-type cytochrome [Thalassotalea crassostreae]|uniref:multiheme c-type cytochrome n=1 Tax=Thalassotalea crassostreae TaxID=1763536 RepID=UPI000AB20910|nr:multiheme c-type cytochrome [Thalassotalea crassostreae]
MLSFLSKSSLLLTSFFLVITSANANTNVANQSDSNPQQCVSCHTHQVSSWEKSDHAKAMAIATKGTVLADFNNTTAKHYGQTAKYYKKQEQFWVDIAYDNKVESLQIKYTFGHYPLQQYLVETEPGRIQVLPFAWDSRSKAEGGQRWYHNYQHEEIKQADRLHWRQPLQNWNGMCADCHSDGLVRNYDAEKNQFDSSYDNINVGCVSCHGDKSEHAKSGKSEGSTQYNAKGGWQRLVGQDTASWHGEKRDNSFMEGCFSCHSLRAPLTDGIKPDTAFLDQFTPQLLMSPLYHVDGQIKEEVYVYGSFLQSKMYAAGVNCIDCHDSHTMKIKVQGNGLCLQCHASEVFDQPKHHNHKKNSEGSQCVNCHMTENRYMGVDDRRDHSFKIPRPDLSEKFDSPNACTTCHEDKNNQWALELVKKWYVTPRKDSFNQQNFWALKSGQQLSLQQHLNIVADESLDIASRATALQMLAQSTQQINAADIKVYLEHENELLRLSAATVAQLIVPFERVQALAKLLVDERKAIRVAAARSMLDVYIPEVNKKSFDAAKAEMMVASTQTLWRGEGRLNHAMTAMATGDQVGTEKAFKGAIKVDPYFDVAYSNLAEYYRSVGKDSSVVSVYNKGLKMVPTSATLRYGYGLHLIRQKQIDKAIEQFEKAVELAPTDPQYPYIHALAYDGKGETNKALSLLQGYVDSYAQNQQLVELGLSLAQKAQNRAAFNFFMSKRNQ